jgi:hypothetical protein
MGLGYKLLNTPNVLKEFLNIPVLFFIFRIKKKRKPDLAKSQAFFDQG